LTTWAATAPQDCELGSWQDWGECTATCGGGERERTREVVTEPVGGGATCGAVTDTITCNDQECDEAQLVAEPVQIIRGASITSSVPDSMLMSTEFTYILSVTIHSLPSTNWRNIFNVQPTTATSSTPRFPGLWTNNGRLLWSMSTTNNPGNHGITPAVVVAGEKMTMAITVSASEHISKLFVGTGDSCDMMEYIFTFSGDFSVPSGSKVYLSERFGHHAAHGDVSQMVYFPKTLTKMDIVNFCQAGVPPTRATVA